MLLFLLISDDSQMFAEKSPRHVQSVIMMFNNAVNAYTVHGVFYVRKIYMGRYFYNALILSIH